MGRLRKVSGFIKALFAYRALALERKTDVQGTGGRSLARICVTGLDPFVQGKGERNAETESYPS